MANPNLDLMGVIDARTAVLGLEDWLNQIGVHSQETAWALTHLQALIDDLELEAKRALRQHPAAFRPAEQEWPH